MAPETSWNVAPASSLRCHWSRCPGHPGAVAVNVAGFPWSTVRSSGAPGAVLPGPKTSTSERDRELSGPLSSVATLRNLASTGLKETISGEPATPLRWAMAPGVVHFAPSMETCALGAEGIPAPALTGSSPAGVVKGWRYTVPRLRSSPRSSWIHWVPAISDRYPRCKAVLNAAESTRFAALQPPVSSEVLAETAAPAARFRPPWPYSSFTASRKKPAASAVAAVVRIPTRSSDRLLRPSSTVGRTSWFHDPGASR
ncbi:hypothetical protein D9M72_477770 [compost metagenome]